MAAREVWVVEPVSLGMLGGVALTEGIKFLYGQVTELLKRRRDKAEKAAEPPTVPAEQATLLDRPLAVKPVDLAVVAANEDKLRQLRRNLADYVDGVEPVDRSDRRLLDQVAALRALLELAY